MVEEIDEAERGAVVVPGVGGVAGVRVVFKAAANARERSVENRVFAMGEPRWPFMDGSDGAVGFDDGEAERLSVVAGAVEAEQHRAAAVGVHGADDVGADDIERRDALPVGFTGNACFALDQVVSDGWVKH
jgi:hypothetical protein